MGVQPSTVQQREGAWTGIARAAGGHGPLIGAAVLGLVVFCGLFMPEIRAAVEVWNESTAYSHCYLILPMALYLLWDRRAVLTEIAPRPQLAWALLAVPVTMAWLVAERLGIMEGRQLTALAALQVLFLTMLGWRLYWALSAGLLYLFFLVPFGAFVTPALQRFTADFSIIGLNLLGIPNFSDNFTIETPAGVFFVAEACAGLRFLIAAVAFGVFYALLNYRSTGRRAAFMLASIAVPIIANGFRALGIVVLGQILGSADAAAADHIIYGWVFFSIVMLLLVAAGQPFRESGPAKPTSLAATRKVRIGNPVWGTLAVLVVMAVGPAVAAVINARAVAAPLAEPIVFVMPAGCVRDAGSATDLQFAVRCGNARLDVTAAVFPARATAAAMVAERRRATQEVGAEDVNVTGLALDGDERGVWSLVQTTDPNRTTAVASWVDGQPAASGLAGRIALARDSLLGADHAPMLVSVSIAEPARASVAERRAAIAMVRGFVDAQSGFGAKIERASRVVPR